jgi:tetratricopeptide (TPR) repeat protein
MEPRTPPGQHQPSSTTTTNTTTTVSLQQALDLAVQHHQAGRLRDAEKIYRQILASDPDNPHALHLLGVLMSQSGRGDLAVEYIRRAIAQNPTAAQYQNNLGAALMSAGRIADAVDTYQRVLVLQPELPEAHANLGIALMRMGKFARAAEYLQFAVKARPTDFKFLDSLGSALSQDNRQEEAIEVLRRALAIRSDFAPTHHTMGNALVRLGRYDEAIAEFRAALALRPDFPEVLGSLSGLLCNKGELDQAIDLVRRSLALQPNSPVAHFNLGRALHRLNRLDESVEALQKTLALDPKFTLALNELGNVYLLQRRFREAIDAFNRMIALEPTGEGRYNLATAFWESGRLDDALAEYQRAESAGFVDPRLFNNTGAIHHQRGQYDLAEKFFRRAMDIADFPLARFNLAMLQLLQGNFKDGFEGYESRWKARSIPMPARYAQYGTWDGRDVAGKRILLDCEQGFGDAIQFARFIPILAQQGARPLLATNPELRRLMRSVPGVEMVVAPPDDIPSFGVQCPLLSLARVLGITLETIPAATPYVFADPQLSQRWAQRVPADGRLKIGLCWSGSPNHLQDRSRSVPADSLAPLAQFERAWFCSLQKFSPDRPRTEPPASLMLADFTPELSDFADTAALIANLDLVIACDTAVAHLAGAMAKPVWLMLPYVPDWRWLLNRTDSPWYPTMCLFRQPSPGDWSAVISDVGLALKSFNTV